MWLSFCKVESKAAYCLLIGQKDGEKEKVSRKWTKFGTVIVKNKTAPKENEGISKQC